MCGTTAAPRTRRLPADARTQQWRIGPEGRRAYRAKKEPVSTPRPEHWWNELSVWGQNQWWMNVLAMIAVMIGVSVWFFLVTPLEPGQPPEPEPVPVPPRPARLSLPEGKVIAVDAQEALADLEHAREPEQPGYQEVRGLRSPESTPGTVARGREVFGINCAPCHGEALEGIGPAGAALDLPPANLRTASGYKRGHRELAVFRTIKYGVPDTGMAPWDGRLADDDMWGLAHYVRGAQKE